MSHFICLRQRVGNCILHNFLCHTRRLSPGMSLGFLYSGFSPALRQIFSIHFPLYGIWIGCRSTRKGCPAFKCGGFTLYRTRMPVLSACKKKTHRVAGKNGFRFKRNRYNIQTGFDDCKRYPCIAGCRGRKISLDRKCYQRAIGSFHQKQRCTNASSLLSRSFEVQVI